MLRILLVDDEPLELQALRDHVDWKRLGIDQVDTAKNGRIAYEMVFDQEPDIVITDVHMPVMDGIMLARKIRDLNQRIKVVFLSGYDDFSYVQSALQMGAADYLLKPFTAADIENVILKVKEALNRDMLFTHSLETLEQQLLERLCLEGDAQQPVLLEELARTRKLSSGADQYGMMIFFSVSGKSLVDHLLKYVAGIHAAWMDENRLGIILRGYADPYDNGLKIQELLEKLTGFPYSGAYLAERSLKDTQLRSSWQALKEMEDDVYYLPAGSFVKVSIAPDGTISSDFSFYPPHVFTDLPDSVLEEALSRLEQLFPYENETETEAEIDRLLKRLREMRLSRRSLENAIWRMLLLLERRLSSGSGSPYRPALSLTQLEGCRCVGELKTLLLGSFRQVLITYQENAGGKNAYVVRRVKEYVQQHYGEPMTVDAIADEIHFSVNYVRSIFKEGTGQTILEYVTDYRFARACELLKDPTLKVREVANMVGYENISYFGSVFTKRYHLTPNEYRKKFL